MVLFHVRRPKQETGVMWYQHTLQSLDSGAFRHCWLDEKLKPGKVVTLKKDTVAGMKWRVNAVYDIALEKPPRQDWHNNI
jgi:hypothetical protein